MSTTSLSAVRELARLLIDEVTVPIRKANKAEQKRYEYAELYTLLCDLRDLPGNDPRVLYMNRRFGSAWKHQKSLKALVARRKKSGEWGKAGTLAEIEAELKREDEAKLRNFSYLFEEAELHQELEAVIKTHLAGLSDEGMGANSDDSSDLAVQIRSDVLRILTEHINRSGGDDDKKPKGGGEGDAVGSENDDEAMMEEDEADEDDDGVKGAADKGKASGQKRKREGKENGSRPEMNRKGVKAAVEPVGVARKKGSTSQEKPTARRTYPSDEDEEEEEQVLFNEQSAEEEDSQQEPRMGGGSEDKTGSSVAKEQAPLEATTIARREASVDMGAGGMMPQQAEDAEREASDEPEKVMARVEEEGEMEASSSAAKEQTVQAPSSRLEGEEEVEGDESAQQQHVNQASTPADKAQDKAVEAGGRSDREDDEPTDAEGAKEQPPARPTSDEAQDKMPDLPQQQATHVAEAKSGASQMSGPMSQLLILAKKEHDSILMPPPPPRRPRPSAQAASSLVSPPAGSNHKAPAVGKENKAQGTQELSEEDLTSLERRVKSLILKARKRISKKNRARRVIHVVLDLDETVLAPLLKHADERVCEAETVKLRVEAPKSSRQLCAPKAIFTPVQIPERLGGAMAFIANLPVVLHIVSAGNGPYVKAAAAELKERIRDAGDEEFNFGVVMSTKSKEQKELDYFLGLCRVVDKRDVLILDNLPEDWDEAAQSRIWPMPEFGNRLNRLITRKEEKATAMRLGSNLDWPTMMVEVGLIIGRLTREDPEEDVANLLEPIKLEQLKKLQTMAYQLLPDGPDDDEVDDADGAEGDDEEED